MRDAGALKQIAGMFRNWRVSTPRCVAMIKLLLWLILFVISWPLALLALVLYPIIWLFLLPFRLFGIAVGAVLQLVKTLLLLPVRVLRSL